MEKKRFAVAGLFSGVLLIAIYIVSGYFELTFVYRNALPVGGVIIMSAGYIYLVFTRIMTHKDYQKVVMGERYVMIREKSGYVTNYVNKFLIAAAILAFIIFDYGVPAIILVCILLLQPIISIIISESMEKHF